MADLEQRAPSDAVLTVPNLLTFLRLSLIAPFLWFALVPDRMDVAFAIAFFALVTDLVDGKIARRYGQISKLGIALDPLSDRLGLASGAVAILVHDLTPAIAVWAVVARDVALVAPGAMMKARGIPIPPVTRVGKWGSFGVSVGFALALAAGIPDANDPQTGVRAASAVVLAVAIPVYYAAGVGYAREGTRAIRRNAGAR